ncbi:MAG: hypothetical protein KJS92_10410 [Bacteroidetes bacterium]|nr:hypothetical protein [Bacteroidota bacterium]
MLSGGFWFGSMGVVQFHRYQTHAHTYVHRNTPLMRIVFQGKQTSKEINYHGKMYDVVFRHFSHGHTVCYMHLDAEENAWLSLSEKFAHPKSDREKSAQQFAGFLLNMHYMHPSSEILCAPVGNQITKGIASAAQQLRAGFRNAPSLPPEWMNDFSRFAI